MLQTPILLTGEFNDGDEFCEAAAGWKLDIRQLDCGKLRATLDQATGSNLVVQRLAFARRVQESGDPDTSE